MSKVSSDQRLRENTWAKKLLHKGKYFRTFFKLCMIKKHTIEIDKSQEPSVLKFKCDFIEGVAPLCSGRSPVLPKQLIAMLISRRAILSSVRWGAATMLFFFSLISKINLKVPNSKSYSNMSTKLFLTILYLKWGY